jgi:hypothetical protein
MTISINKSLVITLACLALLLCISNVAIGKRAQTKQLDAALSKYASSIRWNEFEMAWGFVDPKYRQENPINELDKKRFKLIEITGYDEKTRDFLEDGSVELDVEIRLINRNTQIERVIENRQIWRWDAKDKRWWLTTGLPDFSAQSF